MLATRGFRFRWSCVSKRDHLDLSYSNKIQHRFTKSIGYEYEKYRNAKVIVYTSLTQIWNSDSWESSIHPFVIGASRPTISQPRAHASCVLGLWTKSWPASCKIPSRACLCEDGSHSTAGRFQKNSIFQICEICKIRDGVAWILRHDSRSYTCKYLFYKFTSFCLWN